MRRADVGGMGFELQVSIMDSNSSALVGPWNSPMFLNR